MSACQEEIFVPAAAPLHIRPLQIRDFARVWELEKAIYAFPWSPNALMSCFGEDYLGQALELYRRIVGYGVLQVLGKDCHLLNLGVEPYFQGQGLGSRLLGSMLDAARSQRVKRVFLEVRPSNRAARALYAREDFRAIGLHKGYYPTSTGREDALVLVRLL